MSVSREALLSKRQPGLSLITKEYGIPAPVRLFVTADDCSELPLEVTSTTILAIVRGS